MASTVQIRKTDRAGLKNSRDSVLTLPAIEVTQRPGMRLYLFAVDGKQLDRFSTVSRVSRSEGVGIAGYQRPEVLSHIAEIKSYLESDKPLLPNAIVIAFDERVKFVSAGKSHQQTDAPFSQVGELRLPLSELDSDDRVGWIVDGQQRTAAIRDARVSNFPVCVVGFITGDMSEQRRQFILVNATKPLPKGLIYELLPSTEGKLPNALHKKRFPSVLSERLNYDDDSPFKGMIRTPTNGEGVIADNSILKMIENSLSDGVLYRLETPDQMLGLLKAYWWAVRETFPSDWGLPPKRSRLLHGAGIVSLGFLMDTIADRHRQKKPTKALFAKDLAPMLPVCSWSTGYWELGPGNQLKWNEIQNVSRHIQLLSNYLLVRYKELVWRKIASL